MTPALGTKVVVYGPSGSGKTTLGRAIASALGVPHIELDAIYHCRPAWDDLADQEFRAAVRRVLAEHPGGWVIDGNYTPVRDLILPQADSAVWLRLPFRVVYPRLVRRTLRRAVSRELLWGANRERWRDVFSRESMLIWGIANWRPHHRRTAEALNGTPHSARVLELHSTREVRALLGELASAPGATGG